MNSTESKQANNGEQVCALERPPWTPEAEVTPEWVLGSGDGCTSNPDPEEEDDANTSEQARTGRCSSAEEQLPSVCEVLGSTPSTAKLK